jgi:hypothetical protein
VATQSRQLDSGAALRQAKAFLDLVVVRYPRDVQLQAFRNLVCGEIDIDESCALAAAKARDSLDRRLEGRGRLELVQAAVLNGEFELAHDWIDKIRPQDGEFCYKAVGALFDYWSELRRGKRDHALRKFHDWERAVRQGRERGATAGECWRFGPIEQKALKEPEVLATTLTQMMRATNRKDRAIPTEPITVPLLNEVHDRLPRVMLGDPAAGRSLPAKHSKYNDGGSNLLERVLHASAE